MDSRSPGAIGGLHVCLHVRGVIPVGMNGPPRELPRKPSRASEGDAGGIAQERLIPVVRYQVHPSRAGEPKLASDSRSFLRGNRPAALTEAPPDSGPPGSLTKTEIPTGPENGGKSPLRWPETQLWPGTERFATKRGGMGEQGLPPLRVSGRRRRKRPHAPGSELPEEVYDRL